MQAEPSTATAAWPGAGLRHGASGTPEHRLRSPEWMVRLSRRTARKRGAAGDTRGVFGSVVDADADKGKGGRIEVEPRWWSRP